MSQPRNPYAAFETSKDLEADGIFVDYGMFRVRIARAGGANRRYQTLLEQKGRPHRRAAQLGTLDEETADRIVAEAFAEAVVRDWQTKVVEGEGDERAERWDRFIVMPGTLERLDVTVPNLVRVLLAIPDLFADLREQATSVANFLAAERAEAGKA